MRYNAHKKNQTMVAKQRRLLPKNINIYAKVE